MAPDQPLKRADDVVASEIDGEIVMISLEQGKYFRIDPVGSEIWRLLEDAQSPTAVVERLKAKFDGDPETIEAEAREFIDMLLDKGLVEAG